MTQKTFLENSENQQLWSNVQLSERDERLSAIEGNVSVIEGNPQTARIEKHYPTEGFKYYTYGFKYRIEGFKWGPRTFQTFWTRLMDEPLQSLIEHSENVRNINDTLVIVILVNLHISTGIMKKIASYPHLNTCWNVSFYLNCNVSLKLKKCCRIFLSDFFGGDHFDVTYFFFGIPHNWLDSVF